ARVGWGACTRAARAGGREPLEPSPCLAVGAEQLLGLVAAQPVLEHLQVGGIAAHVRERDLVRTPRAFDLVATDLLRARPALRRAQHDHRPAWALEFAASRASLLPDVADLLH